MSKRFMDYDPHTKTSTWFEGGGTSGNFVISQTQDIRQHLDTAKRLANDSNYKRQGIKNDMYHFARVPNTVLHEILLKYHLNWQNKDDLPKIEKILQRDYKALLTVDRI